MIKKKTNHKCIPIKFIRIIFFLILLKMSPVNNNTIPTEFVNIIIYNL